MLAKRKTIRLKNHDYNASGCYFVTICTKNKENLFGNVVGTVLPDGPQMEYSSCGIVVRQQLETMSNFYEDIVIEKYVVMPNHIHLLLLQTGNDDTADMTIPTNFPNISKLSRFVGTLKRFCNQRCGEQLWQNRFHDHIVRNEADYLRIWEYIDTNPQKWTTDCFYKD